MRALLWLGTAALSGAVLMGLEMVAFRLYAPYFGYSIYVWGSMISVILTAMACGYSLGGWFADRSVGDTRLYSALLFSAAAQFLALLVSAKLLAALANMGEFEGAALATILIFGVPTTTLAAIGPFVVRLLAWSGRVGAAAGATSAASTVGSILGILVTTYYLVPAIGTQATMQVACAVTAALALIGLLTGRRLARATMGLALLVAALTTSMPPLWSFSRVPNSRVVWTSESPYNLVRVIRYGRFHLLALNDDRTSHSMHHDYGSWTGGYHDMFALGPLLVTAERLLVLGLGAGSSVTAARLTAPEIDVDAVEIDPKVVEAGVRYFGLDLRSPKLRVHIADGRRWLALDRGKYDIAQVDLYQGGSYVPFYLNTVEFFRLVWDHLSPDGLLMNNVFDPGAGQELLNATAASLRQVFPSVFWLGDGRGSYMLFAFRSPQAGQVLRDRLASAITRVTGPGVKLLERASTSLTEYVPAATATVFTDDHAPIEAVTRRAIAEYYQKMAVPAK